LDRIDLQVEMPRPARSLLERGGGGEDTATIRQRVSTAHEIQSARQGAPNARLTHAQLEYHGPLGTEERTLLEAAAERLRLSPRACHRVWRVARTVADLAGSDRIGEAHLAEAISLRRPCAPPAIAS
jgi:magnesium chelatase family protein